MRGARRLWLINGKSFHEPAVFLAGKGADLGCVARPLELTGIQPQIQQHKNGLIMMQRFQAVGFSAAEETNRVCIRVHLIGIPDDRHKSIDGEAHIGTACDQTEL